jgi:hypothetical protein
MLNQNVTGRDIYIVIQALAYAIEAIKRLPAHLQPESNMIDMEKLLKHYLPDPSQRQSFIDEARAKLDYLVEGKKQA